jgi:TM2 domain-containing membrane protein YozV
LPVPSVLGPSTASGRNRIAAALFAVLLGGLGIHKFYLGRVWQGILYLVFCWTFIPALVGFIEGIIYLTMSDHDFEQNMDDSTFSTSRLTPSHFSRLS